MSVKDIRRRAYLFCRVCDHLMLWGQEHPMQAHFQPDSKCEFSNSLTRAALSPSYSFLCSLLTPVDIPMSASTLAGGGRSQLWIHYIQICSTPLKWAQWNLISFICPRNNVAKSPSPLLSRGGGVNTPNHFDNQNCCFCPSWFNWAGPEMSL